MLKVGYNPFTNKPDMIGSGGITYNIETTGVPELSKVKSFDSTTTVESLSFVESGLISEITVNIYAVFNGSNPAISVGTEEDNEKFLDNASVYMKQVGMYTFGIGYLVIEPEVINIYVTGSSITEGSGEVIIKHLDN